MRGGYIAFMETVIKNMITETITLSNILHIRCAPLFAAGCDNRRANRSSITSNPLKITIYHST